MNVLEYIAVTCPYCGESNELTIERTLETLSYMEDCCVCCRAMQIDVRFVADDFEISATREND